MAWVLLQMGHAYRRTGATGTNGIDGDPNEQEFAHAACHAAADWLSQAGHNPIVIDADEPDSSYAGFDAFFAVHCDGSTSLNARGASVGYRTPEGAHLAAWWKQAYSQRGWTGFRPDNYTTALAGYYGVREAVGQGCRHACIVEAGFLTSPEDEAALSLPEGPERVARAITDAVVALWGGAQPLPPTPKGTSPDMHDTCAHPTSDRIDAVAIGPDPAGSVWHTWADTPAGLEHATWEFLGGTAKGVSCVWTSTGTEFVVTAHGAHDDMWQRRYSVAEGRWTDWYEAPIGTRLLPPAQNV